MFSKVSREKGKLHNMNRSREVAKLFDNKSEVWSAKYKRDLVHRLYAFESAIVKYVPRRSRIADLGCGSAPLIIHLHPLGFKLSGLDISRKMVEVANSDLIASGISIVIEFGSLEDALRLLGYQEAIVCSSVLEYVDDLPRSLRSISNCLVGGGVAIVSIPNHVSLIRIFERNFMKIAPIIGKLKIDFVQNYLKYLHLSKNRPNHTEFVRLAQNSDLHLVERIYMGKITLSRIIGGYFFSAMSLYVLKKN